MVAIIPSSINFLTISVTGLPIFSLKSLTVISLAVNVAWVIVTVFTFCDVSFFFLTLFLEPKDISSKPFSSSINTLFFLCSSLRLFCDFLSSLLEYFWANFALLAWDFSFLKSISGKSLAKERKLLALADIKPVPVFFPKFLFCGWLDLAKSFLSLLKGLFLSKGLFCALFLLFTCCLLSKTRLLSYWMSLPCCLFAFSLGTTFSTVSFLTSWFCLSIFASNSLRFSIILLERLSTCTLEFLISFKSWDISPTFCKSCIFFKFCNVWFAKICSF